MGESHRHDSRENGLRVAIVHSYYSSRNPSGENAAVEQHIAALRRAGCSVALFAERTDDRESRKMYPLAAALHVASGLGPRPDLAAFAPDVIHVHNLFPNFGKAWLRDAPAPVVTTLHNYRPLCAAGTFYRDGDVCTVCSDIHSSVPAVTHGCYRGRLQSIPVAIGQRFEADLTLTEASAVIALSEQMRDIYTAAGVPTEKIHILPNFLPLGLDGGKGEGGDYWLYAGRFSAEKGIVPLLSQWPANQSIKVVGSGEAGADVAELSATNIEVIGRVNRQRMMELMRGAKGLVFPSKWFEGFPLIYAEALAAGTPIVTWPPSVVAGLVDQEGTGITGHSSSIAETIAVADSTFPQLRDHCRNVFEASYTEDAWISRLLQIYNSVKK